MVSGEVDRGGDDGGGGGGGGDSGGGDSGGSGDGKKPLFFCFFEKRGSVGWNERAGVNGQKIQKKKCPLDVFVVDLTFFFVVVGFCVCCYSSHFFFVGVFFLWFRKRKGEVGVKNYIIIFIFIFLFLSFFFFPFSFSFSFFLMIR